MKLKLVSVLICCCEALFAQGASQTAPSAPYASTVPDYSKRVVKVVRVKGDAEVIAALAGKGSGVDYQVSSALKAIVLKGLAANVADVERTIQELDSSTTANSAASGVRNIELTLYAIAGSSQPITGFDEVSGDALAPVLKQLRAIFSYTHYQLLSTVLMRSAQNTGGGAEGAIRPLQSSDVNLTPVFYRITYNSVGATTDPTPFIHVARLHFGATVPYVIGPKDGSKQYQNFNIGIDSNVDLREGQKVVVGTSDVPEGNTSLFLVLSARLVQ